MRVRGDNAPSNAFSVEVQPKRPGFSLVRFYENVQPFEDSDGDLTISGVEYDEYHLELPASGTLSDYVLENYQTLLVRAKALEQRAAQPSVEEQLDYLEAENDALNDRVSELESQVTDAQEALCDVYELALGGAL